MMPNNLLKRAGLAIVLASFLAGAASAAAAPVDSAPDANRVLYATTGQEVEVVPVYFCMALECSPVGVGTNVIRAAASLEAEDLVTVTAKCLATVCEPGHLATEVATPVTDELPLVWCMSLYCGPLGPVYQVRDLANAGTELRMTGETPEAEVPTLVWCKAMTCGPTGPVYVFLRDSGVNPYGLEMPSGDVDFRFVPTLGNPVEGYTTFLAQEYGLGL